MARERKTKAKKMRNRKLFLIFGGSGLALAGIAVLLFFLLRPIPVESVSFQQEEIRLKAGEKLTLLYSYLPEDATETELSFKSSNKTVATVQNGVLIAVSEGNCYISVTAESGAKDSLRVRVDAPMTKQEQNIVGLWRIFAVKPDATKADIRYLYNDESTLTLLEDRSGSLGYDRTEYSFPDWRFTESKGGYDYFTMKEEGSQQSLEMFFCTDSGSAFENCLMLRLPSGELLLFRQEKEEE